MASDCTDFSLHLPKPFCMVLLIWLSVLTSLARGQSFDLTYYLDEEVPVAHRVGSIANDSDINRLLSATDFISLRYRLLMYPNTDTNLFTISNTTGVLRTASRIDREILCHYEITCPLHLHVAAQTESGQQFYTFSVKVYVRDVNDNSPVFPLSSVTVAIEEDASVLTSVPIAAASDMDILNNTLQRYRLMTSSDIFGLKVSRKLDGSLVPELYLKSELDREKRPFYILTVLALDGGTPRRSGELTVNVTVNDANDNAPLFTQQTYDLVIDEVTPINSRVMTLRATDPDIGQNGRLIYRLGPRQSEEAYTNFRVIPDSGNILTTQDLTPVQGQSMRLVVEAIDHGVKPQTAQAEVNIYIRDSVNNVPIIQMASSSSSSVFHVFEDARPGFVVTHFVVEDNDAGDNGMVTCQLRDHTFGLQRLKSKEYKVSVSASLNREVTPFYDLKISCEDGGQPSLTTTVAFSIILIDTNDNPPRFHKDVYRVNVSENAKNVVAVRLMAEDIDLGQNGRVLYSLGNVTSLVRTHIQVDDITGEVITKQGLDRELFSRLDFQVVAKDDGKKPLSSTARVIIDVTDQNDNIPRVPAGYSLSIMENLPAGTLVGRIRAIDPDLGLAGRVGYQLLSDNGATRLFNLTVNGDVTALRPFDREQRSSYQINVLARDYDTSPRTNILHVRIRITDDNDNPPVFRFPRPGNKTAYVTVDVKQNTTVTRVLARDDDVGENATLHYSLVIGRQDLFDIDTRSGRVYTRRRVNGEDRGSYKIQVVIRDRGPSPLSRSSDLLLVVTQGNGTAASSSNNRNSHIIIVAILIGITIIIAILVFLVVFRFIRKDRHRSRRPKYSGGLPMAVKSRSPSLHDDTSSEEGPWRRYDEAKRPPVGPGIRPTDVTYDTHDDILMFKLKLADQYRELEPEDKMSGNGTLSRDGGDSNRNSVLSEVDGCDSISRDKSARLATFQVKSTPLHSSHTSSLDKNGGGLGSVVKIPEEILSSPSRDLGGADSGRGTSEDGSQGTSSFTDDSGCPTSPGHVTIRGGTTPRTQGGNYSKPFSCSAFDRPPLLMTFQGSNGSTDSATNNSTLPSRRDFTYNSNQTKPSHYDKTARHDTTRDGDIVIHDVTRIGPDNKSPKDEGGRTQTFLKRKLSPDRSTTLSNNVKDLDRSLSNIKDQISAFLRPKDNHNKNTTKDTRMCSNSQPSLFDIKNANSIPSSFTPRGVQETEMPSASIYATQNGGGLHHSRNKPLFVGGTGSPDRPKINNHSTFSTLSGNNARNNTNVSNTTVTPSTSITNKLNSCPQLYKESPTKISFHGTNPSSSASRSRSFHNNRESPLTLPPRSPPDMLNESLETQDDGNTTTTSGSYTIDHDDLNLDLPNTDVYV